MQRYWKKTSVFTYSFWWTAIPIIQEQAEVKYSNSGKLLA